MSRKAMVTRAFKATEVNVLCMDLENEEPCNKVVTIKGTFDDNKKLLKEVRKVVDSDELSAVKIVDTTEVEKLYGMDVQTFIENAVELDPETRKEFEEEEE